MADKKTKIQPADNADVAAGQTSAQEATGELSKYTVEQIAGMKPEEIAEKLNNADAFIKSATQKSQETAEIKRQNEDLKAESKWWKSQAEEAKANMQKFYEQMSQIPQQQTPSTPSQPPKFDPYDPDKSWEANQQYWQNRLDSTAKEFRGELDKLKNETENANLGLRTLKMEKYL